MVRIESGGNSKQISLTLAGQAYLLFVSITKTVNVLPGRLERNRKLLHPSVSTLPSSRAKLYVEEMVKRALRWRLALTSKKGPNGDGADESGIQDGLLAATDYSQEKKNCRIEDILQ